MLTIMLPELPATSTYQPWRDTFHGTVTLYSAPSSVAWNLNTVRALGENCVCVPVMVPLTCPHYQTCRPRQTRPPGSDRGTWCRTFRRRRTDHARRSPPARLP